MTKASDKHTATGPRGTGAPADETVSSVGGSVLGRIVGLAVAAVVVIVLIVSLLNWLL